MVGQTISHYKILEKLGEGGMGVVYKAEDTKLKRTVALKFLPRGLETHEPERARFLQEAQAAAALNHPNICTIHDIIAEGGQQFIVMEYVDGHTVRQKLETGNLKLETILSYAVQIGEALQEAHSKGIVHRDVKTDNIMVNSKNQIKVMDFGLAKLKGSLKLTKTSSTMGTLAYMAPEQIEGGEVDARSDIFSFGVVLYEMLTGHLPFRGEHEAAMVYSIVNEEPTPIQKYLPDVSSELVHILNRALEKDPEDRYQGVHDMVIDLRRLKKQTSHVSRIVSAEKPFEGVSVRSGEPSKGARAGARAVWLSRIPRNMRWVLGGLAVVVLGVLLYVIFWPGAGSPPANEKSIAVLYFENKTGREDLDKMLVGLLNINLTRNKGLLVVSGQRLYDVLRTLGKQDAASIDKTTATEVAKRAGVRSMLVGTIWNVSGKVTVLAELLDVESGSVLNSAHVEVPSADEVFTLADGITEKVNEWFKATPGEPFRSSDAATSSYDAFKSYEKGMRHIYRFEYPEAIKSFEEAVKLDSTFALAHLRLAYCRGFSEATSFSAGRNLELARQSLAKARYYGRNLSERDKRFAQAWEAMVRRDFKTIVAVMRELSVEFPQDQEVAVWLGIGCEWIGLFDEARASFEKAIELDRSYSDAYNFLAYVCAFTGRGDEAISAAKSYTALIPDAWNGYDSECEVYMMLGRYEEALGRANEGLRRFPEHLGFHGRRAQTYFLMGQPDKARLALRPEMARTTSISYLIEGRIKEATDVLRQAIERLRAKNDRENELEDLFYLAKIFLEQHKFEEAVKLLETAKSLSEQVFKSEFNPWPVMCDYYAGLCFIRKGDHAQAEAKAAAIKTAAETKLHDLYYLNLTLGLQAEIELTQGKIREASSSMDKMTHLVRASFPLFRMLDGRISAQLGERMRSQSLYDKTYNLVICQMFDFADFWLERSKLDYYKAQTYEHFGDKAEAIKFYEKAIYNWRNADKDYVNLVDAKARLAKLRGGK